MDVRVEEISADRLDQYAKISIGYWVNSLFQVLPVDGGLGGMHFVEERVFPPYFKDYDHQEPEAGPTFWPKKFDVSRWGFFLALRGGNPVGGAAVAYQATGVNMLEDRSDLAVLWDIRVRPEDRGQGVGAALFRHVLSWAREKGGPQLKIETQNINVQACRFYHKMGCHLGMIHRYGYAAVPGCEDEVMLCWYYSLM